MPRSPNTPIAPQVAACRFQLAALSASRSDAWWNPLTTSSRRPQCPSRTYSYARCAPGKNGISLLHRTNRPDSRTASPIDRAAARSIPNGFSASRSFPAASTSR